MRDERRKEGRKEEASKVKQTTKQSNTAHPRQSLFLRKMSCLRWDSNPRHSTHVIHVHVYMNTSTIFIHYILYIRTSSCIHADSVYTASEVVVGTDLPWDFIVVFPRGIGSLQSVDTTHIQHITQPYMYM